MASVRVLGVDTGSRWCAATAVEPGIVIATGTRDVNPTGLKPSEIDTAPTVDWIILCALWSASEVVAVEHSDAWHPWPDASPQALTASAANWNACDRIVRDLRARSPLPVVVLHRQTWACRVVPHKSGVSDADVTEALPRFFPPASLALLSRVCSPCKSAVHQRDAAGVAVGALLAPKPAAPRLHRSPREGPAKPRAPRDQRGRTQSQASRERAKEAGKAKRQAARLAAGCRCGPRRGPHLLTCPLSPPWVDPTRATRAAYYGPPPKDPSPP